MYRYSARKSVADRPLVSALRAHHFVSEHTGVDAGVFMRRVVDPMKALHANAEVGPP